MTGRLQGAVLMLLGAVLGRLAWGVQLAHYVRPGTRPLVLAAAAVLCVLGALTAACGTTIRAPDITQRRSSDDDRQTSVDGAHADGATRAAWLLLGPVLSIAVAAPPALGVLTAQRAPVAPPRPSSSFAALPRTDPVPIALSDVVLRTVWHAGATLRGRTLRVTGFVARTSPGGFVLARLVITCCAADARPYDVLVRDAGRAPPIGGWVDVSGRYLGASRAGPLVPALDASSVVAVAQPADPYG